MALKTDAKTVDQHIFSLWTAHIGKLFRFLQVNSVSFFSSLLHLTQTKANFLTSGLSQMKNWLKYVDSDSAWKSMYLLDLVIGSECGPE